VAPTDELSELLRDTVVELADTLARGFEVGEFLQFLVDRCGDLLLADTAGVLLESSGGAPSLASATTKEMLDIEDLESSLEQGPCLEAYRSASGC
jgi:hypothetical protein